ncbi:MAG: hypothetical protein ACRDTE_18890 [Pseudonocardiaceae bacterium]
MNGKPDVSTCPVCGRSDRSQPVPAVVASQTTHTSGYGTSLGMAFAYGRAVPVAAYHLTSSTAQSPLAQMLDLPHPRRPWHKAGWGIVLLVPLLLFFLTVGIVTLDSMIGTVAGSIPWVATFGMLILITIFELVLLFPLSIGGIALIAQHRRDSREWRQQVERWQQARGMWITLRYCHRDHVVYKWPDITISPAMVRQFTYGQTGR